MAQRVKTFYVSDLSGEELGDDVQTIKFGWLGVDYEIDLSQEEADEFANVIDKYVSAGRRVGGRRQAPSPASSGPSRGNLAAIRDWARENGYNVSSRGRIAQEVVDAYEAANG